MEIDNRIGQFFEAMPDADEAACEMAQHLRKFWEPRMRRELLAHLDTTGGEGLRHGVRNAVRAHRALLERASAAPAASAVSAQTAGSAREAQAVN